MDLETLHAWQRIFRDFVIVAVGAFLLIYEAVGVDSPNLYVIGAGMGCFGLPVGLRLSSDKSDGSKDG